MKKLTAVLLIVLIAFSLSGCVNNESTDNGKIKIISTIFPQYSFAKEIAGDKAEVSMLLPPSAESHSYEPSPKDIISVSESDLFIYVGGNSDNWIEEMLGSLDKQPELLKAFDCVELIGDEHGYDEHVWTSPENARLISSAICEKLCSLSPENEQYFKNNLKEYIEKLEELDREFYDVCENSKRETLIFGDKFPFRYFAQRYGLECYSAYSDCGSEAEPSARMVAELTDRVKNENIPAVLYIEFSNQKVADSIAESAKAKAMELHSCHNVTKEQLENNVTYISLMKQNLNVLKEALN